MIMVNDDIICSDIAKLLSAELEFSLFLNKNVLITGATSMIGSYITKCFLECNANVTILIRNRDKAERIFANYINNGLLTIIEHNITQNIALDTRFDYIIAGASKMGFENQPSHLIDLVNTNIISLDNLLKIAKEDNSKLCYLSSISSYGHHLSNDIIKEGSKSIFDIKIQNEEYCASKFLGEILCKKYNEAFGIPTYVFRLACVVGISPIVNTNNFFITWIQQVAKGNNISIESDGARKNSYIYVADCVLGFFNALLKGSPGTYNLSIPENYYSLQEYGDFCVAAGKEYYRDLQLNVLNKHKMSTIYQNNFSNSKIVDLGFKPNFSIEEGIKRAVKHYYNNP